MDSKQSEDFLYYLAIGGFISLLLLFLIIRWAVASYLTDITKELKKANRLKYLNLKKQGVTDEDISKELSKDNS